MDLNTNKSLTEYRLNAKQDYWYYYDWYYLNMGQRFEGLFGVNLYINDRLEHSTNAYYGHDHVRSLGPKPKLKKGTRSFYLDGIIAPTTVRIVTLSGQTVMEKEIIRATEILTSGLNKGIYIIRLMSRNQNWNYKLSIE